MVIDALWEAPGHRLPGADLSRAVIDAGYTRYAAEKVKTRLKDIGVLIKHPGISFWSLAPHVLEPGVRISAFGACGTDERPGSEDGQAIVDVLSDAGLAGLTGKDLIRAAERRGVPPHRAIQARVRLRAARRIECDGGPGARWRIADAGMQADGARQQAVR